MPTNMLTQNDFNQIRDIVSTLLDQKLDEKLDEKFKNYPTHTELKEILDERFKKNTDMIIRKQNIIISFLDNEGQMLKQRVTG